MEFNGSVYVNISRGLKRERLDLYSYVRMNRANKSEYNSTCPENKCFGPDACTIL